MFLALHLIIIIIAINGKERKEMKWANRHIQSCEATRIENIRISRTLNRQEFRIFAQRNIWNGKMLSEQYMTIVEYFTDGWHSFHRVLCIVHIHSNNELDTGYWIRTKHQRRNIKNVRSFITFSGWISKAIFRLLFAIRVVFFFNAMWYTDVAAAFRSPNLASIPNTE